jgi:hypothetical protein
MVRGAYPDAAHCCSSAGELEEAQQHVGRVRQERRQGDLFLIRTP